MTHNIEGKNKTKEQLINEPDELRGQLAKFEALKAECDALKRKMYVYELMSSVTNDRLAFIDGSPHIFERGTEKAESVSRKKRMTWQPQGDRLRFNR